MYENRAIICLADGCKTQNHFKIFKFYSFITIKKNNFFIKFDVFFGLIKGNWGKKVLEAANRACKACKKILFFQLKFRQFKI